MHMFLYTYAWAGPGMYSSFSFCLQDLLICTYVHLHTCAEYTIYIVACNLLYICIHLQCMHMQYSETSLIRQTR